MLSFPLQPVLLRALNSHPLQEVPRVRSLRVGLPGGHGPGGAPPAPCGTGAGPTAQAMSSTFTPRPQPRGCQAWSFAAAVSYVQWRALQSAHPPSPSVSFLLQLQRSLGPGSCPFPAFTHDHHPQQHSPLLRGARSR